MGVGEARRRVVASWSHDDAPLVTLRRRGAFDVAGPVRLVEHTDAPDAVEDQREDADGPHPGELRTRKAAGHSQPKHFRIGNNHQCNTINDNQ